jgi:hypothetical protein
MSKRATPVRDLFTRTLDEQRSLFAFCSHEVRTFVRAKFVFPVPSPSPTRTNNPDCKAKEAA